MIIIVVVIVTIIMSALLLLKVGIVSSFLLKASSTRPPSPVVSLRTVPPQGGIRIGSFGFIPRVIGLRVVKFRDRLLIVVRVVGIGGTCLILEISVVTILPSLEMTIPVVSRVSVIILSLVMIGKVLVVRLLAPVLMGVL